MLKQLMKPRAVLPMGMALGLLVLFELGAVPVPFDADAGPIGRAAIAVGVAVVGGLLGYALLAILKRVWPKRAGAGDENQV